MAIIYCLTQNLFLIHIKVQQMLGFYHIIAIVLISNSKMIDFSKFDSLISMTMYFNSEDVCKQTIIETRWGVDANQDVVCQYCGEHHCAARKDGRFRCNQYSGCYHDVSDEHIQQYIDEAVYRWNTRKASKTERFQNMFNKSIGLVITWNELKLCEAA